MSESKVLWPKLVSHRADKSSGMKTKNKIQFNNPTTSYGHNCVEMAAKWLLLLIPVGSTLKTVFRKLNNKLRVAKLNGAIKQSIDRLGVPI